jgi:hypothetical protein
MDNQAACSTVQVGSMRRDLHDIAIRIFQLCSDNKIELAIEWVPQTELQKADCISRFKDIDDWQITPECFRYLDSAWGQHTIDCYTNYYNKKIDRFYSWHWNPGCTGVDFFLQNLKGENCLVAPPVSLITQALNYLLSGVPVATVVVLFWPSAQFWPTIVRQFYKFIIDYKVFKGKDILWHGRNNNSIFGPDFLGDMLAPRMDFRRETAMEQALA